MRPVVNFGDVRLPDRFWSKVAPCPISGCWLWIAHLSDGGYGFFSIRPLTRRAHRIAFEALVGEIPAGLELDHLCRVRCCVNPAHLEPVSHLENMRRGCQAGVERTHCLHGHPFDGDNLIVNSRGERCCRICVNARSRRYGARQRARNDEAVS